MKVHVGNIEHIKNLKNGKYSFRGKGLNMVVFHVHNGNVTMTYNLGDYHMSLKSLSEIDRRIINDGVYLDYREPRLNGKVVVYQMDSDSCECIATPWSLERTIEWYIKTVCELDQEQIEGIEEVSDSTIFWDEISEEREVTYNSKMDRPAVIGDVMRLNYTLFEAKTYRQYINEFEQDIKEPFNISVDLSYC